MPALLAQSQRPFAAGLWQNGVQLNRNLSACSFAYFGLLGIGTPPQSALRKSYEFFVRAVISTARHRLAEFIQRQKQSNQRGRLLGK